MLISFFPLLLWITAENRTEFNNLFIWTTKSGGTQHHKQINCSWLLIGNCNKTCNGYGLNLISTLFPIAGMHSTTNLKIYGQAKNFFYPANVHSPSEETIKEKRKTFIGMCSHSTWFNMQILNLCMHNHLKYQKWSFLRRLKINGQKVNISG